MATLAKGMFAERTLWTVPYFELDNEESSLRTLGNTILSIFTKYVRVRNQVHKHTYGQPLSAEKASALARLYKKQDGYGKEITTQLIDFKTKAAICISGGNDKLLVERALSELNTQYSSVIGGKPETNLNLY